jgi:cell shape-determining protein MreD
MGGEMITRHLAIACLIYTVLVLQPSTTSDFAAVSIRLWLPGMAVVACVLMFDGAASLVWAGILGLGIDCQSVDKLGVHLVIATLVVSVLITMRADSRSPGSVAVAAFVFGATFVWRTAAWIAHGLLDGRSIDVSQLGVCASFDAVCTSASVLALSLTGRMLMKAVSPQQDSSVSLGNRWSMLTGK